MFIKSNNKDAIITIIFPVIHLYCPLYKDWSRTKWGGGGQKMVSSTEWTPLSVASHSLWCSRLPPSFYPPCICPLIPDVRPAHPTMGGCLGPTPQPRGSDPPYRGAVVTAPSKSKTVPLWCPHGQHSTAPSLAVVNSYLQSAPRAATASHAWERPALTVPWASRPFHEQSPFNSSLVVRHMQGAAGGGHEPRILKGLPMSLLLRSPNAAIHSHVTKRSFPDQATPPELHLK